MIEAKIIINEFEKYDFSYIDYSEGYVRVGYKGNDIDYYDEDDFDDYDEYLDFADEMGEIVCEYLDEIKENIENKNIQINIEDICWDCENYTCVDVFYA